jgi:hypothetical protein
MKKPRDFSFSRFDAGFLSLGVNDELEERAELPLAEEQLVFPMNPDMFELESRTRFRLSFQSF